MCHSKEQLIAMVVGFSWLFLRPESDLGQGKGANGAQSLQGAGGGCSWTVALGGAEGVTHIAWGL